MELFQIHLNPNYFLDNLQFQMKNPRECRTKLFYTLSSVGLDKPYFEKLKVDFQVEITEKVCPETPISRSNKKRCPNCNEKLKVEKPEMRPFHSGWNCEGYCGIYGKAYYIELNETISNDMIRDIIVNLPLKEEE